MHCSVISALSRAQILHLQTLHQCKFNIHVTIWITVTVSGSWVLFHHNNINSHLSTPMSKNQPYFFLFCIFYICDIISTEFPPSLLSQQPVCTGNGAPPVFILIQSKTIPKAVQKHNKGSINSSSVHSAMKANRPSKLIQQLSPAQIIES